LLEAHALAALAEVAGCLGQHDAAHAHLAAAAALRRALGDEAGAAALMGGGTRTAESGGAPR
jgi:hypothetical protein